MQGPVEHHKDARRLTEIACEWIPDLPPERLSRRPVIRLQIPRRTPAISPGYLFLPAGDQRIDLVSLPEKNKPGVLVAGTQGKCAVNRSEVIPRMTAACRLQIFLDFVLEIAHISYQGAVGRER